MFKFAGCLLQCFGYIFSLVCPKFEELKQRSEAASFSAVITAADYTLTPLLSNTLIFPASCHTVIDL